MKNNIFKKNKYTILSLAIILGMFAIVQSYYDPAMNIKKRMLTKQAIQHGLADEKIGGKFTLINQNGDVFTEKDLLNHYSLIFFGYTFCPDVCPTTLANLSEVYKKLPQNQQQQISVIMVTVDPERDTPQVLKEYITVFNPSFTALTGSREQIKNITKKYNVFYKKSGNGEDYAMNHTGYIYLMGADGKFIQRFNHTNTPASIYSAMVEFLQK